MTGPVVHQAGVIGRVSRQAAKLPIRANGMNAAKTHHATSRAASMVTPSAKPDALATMPVAAEPTAKPIICVVGSAG